MITLQEILERDKRPPSVTVSMLCYNHSKYIDEAIQGVLMQKTNFPVNIVIHDDASPDGSAEIIRRYAAENPNITAILQPVNLLQNGKSAMPFLLPHYTGKYMAFCECDDFWIDEHKLQMQVDYLESNPDCMAVYSNVRDVDKHSELAYYPDGGFYKKIPEGDYPKNYILGIRHQTATCVLRNFFQFMTPEEIALYQRITCHGDEKLLIISVNMGRVHHFAQELAAHRIVSDEGDSWTARITRADAYTRFCITTRDYMGQYDVSRYFFGKAYRRRYIFLLWCEIRGRMKFHKSVIRDAKLDSSYSFKTIPLYAYAAMPFYALYRMFIKAGKILLPKKVLAALQKFSS